MNGRLERFCEEHPVATNVLGLLGAGLVVLVTAALEGPR